MRAAPSSAGRRRQNILTGKRPTSIQYYANNLDFQCDVTALPLASGTFDAVFASFALETLGPGIGEALDEIRRVLVGTGRLCTVSIADRGGFGPMTRLYRAAHRHLPTLVDCRPLDAEAIMAAHGFRVMDVRRARVWGLPVAVIAARLR